MLMPKRSKFRKQQRGRIKGRAFRGSSLSFGDYGLSSLSSMQITNQQIEAARIVMARSMKRGGKIYIMVFPDVPYTKKPAETRMGKGKGNPEGWVCKIKRGRILFEISGVSESIAKKAIKLASSKLSIKSKFVMREEWVI